MPNYQRVYQVARTLSQIVKRSIKQSAWMVQTEITHIHAIPRHGYILLRIADQWIGVGANLQETTIFTIKIYGFPVKIPIIQFCELKLTRFKQTASLHIPS